LVNKIYYLSTCDTCKKILKEIGVDEHDFLLQDIKSHPLTAQQIDELAGKAGGYEALTSKKATLWRERKLSEKQLSEPDYRNLLLEHYTFLKRPVMEVNGQLFAGNERKTVAAVQQALKA